MVAELGQTHRLPDFPHDALHQPSEPLLALMTLSGGAEDVGTEEPAWPLGGGGHQGSQGMVANPLTCTATTLLLRFANSKVVKGVGPNPSSAAS